MLTSSARLSGMNTCMYLSLCECELVDELGLLGNKHFVEWQLSAMGEAHSWRPFWLTEGLTLTRG